MARTWKKKMDEGHCFGQRTTRWWYWGSGGDGLHTHDPPLVGAGAGVYDGCGVRVERLTYLFNKKDCLKDKGNGAFAMEQLNEGKRGMFVGVVFACHV